MSSSDFGDWLELNMAHLEFDGIRLALVKRQWRTPARMIADLVCRVIAGNDSATVGDLVVVENRAIEADVHAVHQLAGYVDHLDKAHPEAAVFGLLVAPGFGDAARSQLTAEGFGGIRWAELGYFDHVWHPNSGHTTIADVLG